MATTRFGFRAAIRDRGLRLTRSAVARGALVSGSIALLGACASQENDALESCNPKSAGCVVPEGGSASNTGGATSSAGGSNSSGDSSGGSDVSASGSTSTGGTSDTSGTSGSTSSTSSAGSTAGGVTFGGSAGTSSAGTSSAGTANGGTANGGTANGGAAHGGMTSAGAGGTASAGTSSVAGSGGATGAACTTAIAARTGWIGTASSFSNVCTDPTYGLCNPPAYAIDANPSSRFSTGTKQVGGEWLQIDLGASGTVDQVTISVSNGDYGRHLQIRMSNSANDTAAAVLAEQDGVTGLLTFEFAAKTARYVLITQTGMDMGTDTAWWSVQDVTATCN